MEWEEGNRLVYIAHEEDEISYSYNSSGLRLTKTVNGVLHNYYYAVAQLLRETYGNSVLDFSYDQSGAPYALTYNGTTYYYILNLQGDVMALVDASNNVVAQYTYSPYGEVLTATGTMANINPLRYRGYYYDTESSFYYLQSRYYNPLTGRFISADSYISTGQGLLGFNMYAYCNNNPVGYVDKNGNNTEALQWWSSTMWWLCGVDTLLPAGDLVYIGVIVILGLITMPSDTKMITDTAINEAVLYGTPDPNNDDDDYYENDNNFANNQKIGKPNGKTPGNNRKQNKDFRDATRGLNKDQKRALHNLITKQCYGYHEIKGEIDLIWAFVLILLGYTDEFE